MHKPIGPAFPVALLCVLNLADAILTLAYVDNVVMREGNPLMAWLLSIGDWAFLAYKVGFLSAVFCVIYKCWWHYRWIPAAAALCIWVYTFLLGYWTAGILILE